MAQQQSVKERYLENPDLKKHLIKGNLSTSRPLGKGAFGTVFELQLGGTRYAGKKIHDLLLGIDNVGVQSIVRKFVDECHVMAEVRHPNIVQFYGICFLEGSEHPVLVMEYLDMSLDYFLQARQGHLQLSLKYRVLRDITRGLLYLHNHDPIIIHRDITSGNILIYKTSLQAKIADLGNALIADSKQLINTHSEMPGTAVYMPPEANGSSPKYDSSLDMFSFGHLALYTITEEFPCDLLPATYCVDLTTEKVHANSEVERRQMYLNTLYQTENLGKNHDICIMIRACLSNNPSKRPTALQVLNLLEEEILAQHDTYSAMVAADPCILDLVNLVHNAEDALVKSGLQLTPSLKHRPSMPRVFNIKGHNMTILGKGNARYNEVYMYFARGLTFLTFETKMSTSDFFSYILHCRSHLLSARGLEYLMDIHRRKQSGVFTRQASSQPMEWKQYVFKIEGQYLKYYKSAKPSKVIGEIHLRKVQSVSTTESSQKFPFTIEFESDPSAKSQFNKALPSPWTLAAYTAEDRLNWMEAIKPGCVTETYATVRAQDYSQEHDPEKGYPYEEMAEPWSPYYDNVQNTKPIIPVHNNPTTEEEGEYELILPADIEAYQEAKMETEHKAESNSNSTLLETDEEVIELPPSNTSDYEDLDPDIFNEDRLPTPPPSQAPSQSENTAPTSKVLPPLPPKGSPTGTLSSSSYQPACTEFTVDENSTFSEPKVNYKQLHPLPEEPVESTVFPPVLQPLPSPRNTMSSSPALQPRLPPRNSTMSSSPAPPPRLPPRSNTMSACPSPKPRIRSQSNTMSTSPSPKQIQPQTSTAISISSSPHPEISPSQNTLTSSPAPHPKLPPRKIPSNPLTAQLPVAPPQIILSPGQYQELVNMYETLMSLESSRGESTCDYIQHPTGMQAGLQPPPSSNEQEPTIANAIPKENPTSTPQSYENVYDKVNQPASIVRYENIYDEVDQDSKRLPQHQVPEDKLKPQPRAHTRPMDRKLENLREQAHRQSMSSLNMLVDDTSEYIARPQWAKAATNVSLKEDESLNLLRRQKLFIPGEKIQDMKIIGQGQYGQVYKANYTRGTGNPVVVAVKTIKKYQSKKAHEDFLKEMGIMAQFAHPNVIKLYGLVQQDSPWIILEYLENGDLKTFLKCNPQPVMILVKYMLDIAMGMHYLADKGLVHRDIAARNIIVGSSESDKVCETCKISDFGLLREIPKDDSIYVAKQAIPVPVRWMAPESLKKREFSTASDVWSYGILLWEMSNPSNKPYSDIETNLECATQVLDGLRLDIPANYPGIVKRIMRACWQKEPSKRPSFLLISTFLSDEVEFQN